jgi:UDP-N-acetylmuramoylalanine--D-glutamate ligase
MIVAPGAGTLRSLLVLGFGVTGRALIEFSLRSGVRPFVSERSALRPDAKRWLDERGIPWEEAGHTERFLGDADAVVLSPGVPPSEPIVGAAEAAGIPVLSELDLAALQAPSIPIVAVTGTNGKGTTVTLIDAILRVSGHDPRLGGNIGIPFVSLLEGISGSDVVVLEASSYQLEQSRFLRPRVGVLLNLTPDHLARHGTMAAYAAAKGRLFLRQERGDTAVLPAALAARFPQGLARRVLFDERPLRLPAGGERLAPHNRLNLAAAICAVEAFDSSVGPAAVDVRSLADAFRLPHRMEHVGTIDGVAIIDDSKSTNADSAVAALRAMSAPTVLLLGGRSKGAGYEALAAEIGRSDIRAVILFGEAGEEIQALLARSGIEMKRAASLERAVEAGLAAARPGDALLLSPACSSFDAFRDFAERGDAFVRAVRERPGFTPCLAKDAGG